MKNCIPILVQQQVGSILNVPSKGISKMRKRPVKVGKDEVRFWLEETPANSKYVLKAHFLVAGNSLDKGYSQFEKLSISTSNGSRVTYSFTTWDEVAVFLNRLPSSMPTNAVTELRGKDNTELNVAWLFYKIDLNWGEFTVQYNRFPRMRQLQRELRSVGIAA